MHPHETRPWARAWAEVHDGELVELVEYGDDGGALLRLVRLPDGSFRSPRYAGVTAFGSVLTAERCAVTLRERLVELGGPVHVRGCPTRPGQPLAALGPVTDLGPTVVVDVARDETAAWARLAAGVRRDIARARRDGWWARSWARGELGFADALGTAAAIAARAGKPWPASAHVLALEGPVPEVQVHLAMNADGTPGAACLTVSVDDHADLWASAYEPAFARENPSKLCHWHMLRRFAGGLVHLGGPAGTEPDALFAYKLRLGGRVTSDLIVRLES